MVYFFQRPNYFIKPQAPPANYVYPYPRRPVYSPSHRSDYVNEMDLLRGASRNGNIRPPNSALYSDKTSRRRNWYEMEKNARSNPRQNFIPRGRSLRMEQPKSNVNKNNTRSTPLSIDIEDHKDWHHYRAHKERRDIYDQLQAITSLLVTHKSMAAIISSQILYFFFLVMDSKSKLVFYE